MLAVSLLLAAGLPALSQEAGNVRQEQAAEGMPPDGSASLVENCANRAAAQIVGGMKLGRTGRGPTLKPPMFWAPRIRAIPRLRMANKRWAHPCWPLCRR